MFDGVFLHHLTKELSLLRGLRINKVNATNETDFFFILQNKQKLFFSLNSNNPHIRTTTFDYVNSSKIYSMHSNLKRYLESGIIDSITQYQNDRVLTITVNSFDDLGYQKKINLILEFFGRNSNLILTDENFQIIDCLKRLFPNDNGDRVVLPKSIYYYPNDEKVNPFTTNEFNGINIYQGVSNLCFEEILYNKTLNVINTSTKPVLINLGKKQYFYAFDLHHLYDDITEKKYFNSLSELLEVFYSTRELNNNYNNEQEYLQNHIKKEIEKITTKINKQSAELEKANDNLKYEKLGNLLSSYLHLIKKGDKSITVYNYYDNNDITINLDSELTPSQNLKQFFSKYSKAKRAIDHINEQLIINHNEIEYLKCLLNQLAISKSSDIKEIYQELGIKTNKGNKVKSKPNYLIYHTEDNDIIYVGKNNIQNNYITHKLANNNDYFFHIQNIPGSHCILKTTNLTKEKIELAATIAAYYSTYRSSTNVCVDYTLIKFVRKVPGINGSFVTYKNQKSVFVKPDLEYIKKHTKNN